MNKIKAVIFDFDGTMVNSNWVWDIVNEQFLREHNVQYDETLKALISGMSSERIVQYLKKTYNLKSTKGDIIKRWKDLAQRYYNDEVTIKEGLPLFLDDLKKRDIKIGIATGGIKEIVVSFMEKHGLDDYINIIVDTDMVENGKPYPDIFQYVAKALEVKNGECLVYEDVLSNIEAAASLGMEVCLVKTEGSVSVIPNNMQACRCICSFIGEIGLL